MKNKFIKSEFSFLLHLYFSLFVKIVFSAFIGTEVKYKPGGARIICSFKVFIKFFLADITKSEHYLLNDPIFL
ncbi:MAG: hypothetical protein WAM54_01280 [Nitrososphaeraceae archaeon]